VGSTPGEHHHAPHWSYSGEGAPAHWGELKAEFGTCAAGQAQSPINLTGAASAPVPALQVNYGSTTLHVVNNGHTIQANVDSGSTLTVAGKTYNLLQFHFHSPSEHTVDGQPADMVAHFVHKAEDSSLAVIGVLIQAGAESAALAPVLSNMPAEEGGKVDNAQVTYDLASILPADRSHFHYSGSLTTPPCSEGVDWNVMATPVQISAAQLDAYRHLYLGNARPVQPLNGRALDMGM